MPDSKTLTASLLRSLGKQSSALLEHDDTVPTAKLQEIVGVPESGPSSAFVQFRPGGPATVADENSPTQGDDIFWIGMRPGSRFIDKNGQTWEIEEYDYEAKVLIRNCYYGDFNPVVNVQDIRRSIHQWIHPIQQIVPPPPVGIDYGVVETKSVK